MCACVRVCDSVMYTLCVRTLPKVSALGMDPSGARVITGGYDYTVRLWDFAGMDSRLKSFRTITPCQRWTLSKNFRQKESIF